MVEFYDAEAKAASYGLFFHKSSKLNSLRNEISQIPDIEWEVIEQGKKIPVTINIHHTQDELLNLHTTLSDIHRGYEQRVNFYKAKVKNLVTQENARIHREIQCDISQKRCQYGVISGAHSIFTPREV